MYSCISNYSFFCERLLVHLTLDLNQSMPDPDLSLTSVCYCAVEVFRETWKLKVGGGKKNGTMATYHHTAEGDIDQHLPPARSREPVSGKVG